MELLVAHEPLEALEVRAVAERYFQPARAWSDDSRRGLRVEWLRAWRVDDGEIQGHNQSSVERVVDGFELFAKRAQEHQCPRTVQHAVIEADATVHHATHGNRVVG